MVHQTQGISLSVMRKIVDKQLFLLIRRYLQAGILQNGTLSERKEGTPQGGPPVEHPA